jgi:hypothetical protein
MTISDFQIGSVIRTYVRNMRTPVRNTGKSSGREHQDDMVALSDEGIKKMMFERISEQIVEGLKNDNET